MVGKLNEMVTAAVVIDSTLKTKPSDTQSQNATAQIKPVDAKQSAATIKPQDAQSANLQTKAEEEKEGRLKPGTMTEDAVKEMLEDVNKLMNKTDINLEFTYDKKAEIFNVKVIDKETKKVIREFPPEEMLESMRKAKDMLGALIDKAI